MVSGLPRGFVKDLFEVEGCGWGRLARNFGFASLQFRSDGLPRNVSMLLMPFGVACRRAAQSLFLMALAPGGEYIPRDRAIVYAASMDPEEMSCNEGSELDWVPGNDDKPTVMRVRAKVSRPKLKRKIKPVYPEAARRSLEQGISIYEAIVTSTGCIRELRLVKSSSSLLLDVAAMQAVSRWRYEPATLDGRPVNVYLTVTVTFNLD
jgi:protein TonB